MLAPAPVFFLSHGSPMRVLETTPARDFLQTLGDQYDKPKGIVVISPHWESQGVCFTEQTQLQTIHDFWGFPDELYQIQYPVESPKWLQNALSRTLQEHHLQFVGEDRGLDHGAWSVLSLMYPEAQIPVVGLSLPYDFSLVELFALGESLQSLRQQGIMIVTTGLVTHNLTLMAYQGLPDKWAIEFVEWLQEKISTNDLTAIFNYRQQAPWATTAHPRDDHLRPLLIALGAGGATQGNKAKLLHESWELKNASNASWVWS